MPASRRVTRAVNSVLDLAPRRGEVSLARLVEAVSEDRGRPIEVTMADLPPGVCGQWRQYNDRDVFLLQKGLPAGDRTLAHELGHLLFGFPDLYDTDYTSEGIGDWCLMAAGSWNGGGDTPAEAVRGFLTDKRSEGQA